ncbi:unnamed protein product [Vitrella brassicaformis CCMP3155]|uniref:Uncharacterized protein n=2 Tax=Vitrella brassicaformis TaxID=1169539 RepID=A0A0G4FWA5_VITBC|nr:unnamed protein product [Vitrella brassicaformis CCMP3155]|eukprot:CEM19484.1 unnamed protein product [Vitrella brassicaformis CCMP3155]
MSKKTQADSSGPSHPVGLDSVSFQLTDLGETLLQSLYALRDRIKVVAELIGAAEGSSSSQAENSASERVDAQRAVLLSVVEKLRASHDPSKIASVVQLANAKCDLITAMIEQPALFVSPLMTLPEGFLTSHIGPHLGTKDIITRLAPTHPYLHTTSRKPAMHKTLQLKCKDFCSKVKVTKKQVSVWGPAFSQTQQATMVCLPSRGVLALLEHASSTLEELHAWPDVSCPRSLESLPKAGKPTPRRGDDEVVFPKLVRVKVAGWWITVANKRRWKPMSLVDVHLRDMYGDMPVSPASAPMCSGNGGDACTAWLAGPGPHSLTLEAGWDGWELSNIQNMVKPSIKQLRGVEWEGGWETIAASGLQLEEFHATVTFINDHTLEDLDSFRTVCIAPNGTINFTCTPCHPYFCSFDIMRAYPSCTALIISLAAAVKTVVFPSGLAQGQAVPPVVLYGLPQLVFSQTETLHLSSAGPGSRPLPDLLLSGLSDSHFPSVTTLGLGQAKGIREEAVSKATALKSLTEVRFERNGAVLAPFFFPRCLGVCSKSGPLLHVIAEYGSKVCFNTGVWSLWEGGAGAGLGAVAMGVREAWRGVCER